MWRMLVIFYFVFLIHDTQAKVSNSTGSLVNMFGQNVSKNIPLFVKLVGDANMNQGREEKLLSMFNIIKFPNSICEATSGYNGKLNRLTPPICDFTPFH